MSQRMLIKQLENRAALQLLLFLYRHGKTKITDVDIESSYTSLYRGLTILGKLGLVNEERAPPMMRYLLLSSEGKKVAEKLAEIENILEATTER